MKVDSLTSIAKLFGEAGRIRMLAALMDGSGHSASELALAAGVSPQTASSHLSKLLTGGIITSSRRGRQRLFQLRSAEVAVAIEALGALAPGADAPLIPEMRFARTCYDHLAGVLAIALRQELLKRDFLRLDGGAFMVTDAGERFLHTIDIDVDSLRKLRRSFARKCLDWTEAQHHIGGSLGAAIFSRFVEMKWVARGRDSRIVRLTQAGESGLERVFSIRCTRFQTGLPSSRGLQTVTSRSYRFRAK